MMRTTRHALIAVLLLAASVGARAGDAIEPASVELVANYHAASVYVRFAGDDNANATARLSVRAGDDKEYRPALALDRTRPTRFAGSVLNLQPDRPLAIRVTIEDPDGGGKVLAAEGRTRSDQFPHGGGRKIYVSPNGDDRGGGTMARPLATLQKAVDSAEPGDTIIILAALPPVETIVRRSGRADAYITITGPETPTPRTRGALSTSPSREELRNGPRREAGVVVRLSGAEPIPVKGAPGPDGLWRIDHPAPTGLVLHADGARLYRHQTLKDLADSAHGIKAGWHQDAKGGPFAVRPDRTDPALAKGLLVGKVNCLIRFDRCVYWRVSGLEFAAAGTGPYGRLVELDNAHHVVIEDCAFSAARTMVLIRGPAAEWNLVQRCRFSETSIFSWPWAASKGHDVEGAAVALAGGRGNVVRHNLVTGPFNGITASTWDDLENESLNRDLDIHDNALGSIADDPLEPEGACTNVRFWSNTTRTTLSGISLAPITVGPVYVVRDRYVDFTGTGVKLGAESRGPVHVYHTLIWAGRDGQNAVGASGSYGNLHLANCILRGTRYVVEDFQPHDRPCSFERCCFYTTDRERFVKWAGKVVGPDELAGEKTFRRIARVEPYVGNPALGAAKLSEKLIDAGVPVPGVNDGFRGAAPDIGPEETR